MPASSVRKKLEKRRGKKLPPPDTFPEDGELKDVVERLGIGITSKYGGVERPADWQDSHPYLVTLTFQSRKLQTPFFMGLGHDKPPSAADVLSSLASDARLGELSFKEYCSELGCDEDSRKQHKTWQQTAKMAPKVKKFLGPYFDIVERTQY